MTLKLPWEQGNLLADLEPPEPPLPTIDELIAAGALFAINTSGGKDSQAMTILLHKRVPRDQILMVYARLPGVVWEGVEEHIHATTFGLPVQICQAKHGLLDIVARRGMFPSPAQRWCTSDLKRSPIEKLLRATGRKLIVNCTGLRAEESPNRAKKASFQRSERNSKAGRDWYEWLPIQDMTEAEVFASIAAAGQKPHWAYAAGMKRLSCILCIFSSDSDLRLGATLNPAVYQRYVAAEKATGHVMMMPTKKLGRRTLTEITGIPAEVA